MNDSIYNNKENYKICWLNLIVIKSSRFLNLSVALVTRQPTSFHLLGNWYYPTKKRDKEVNQTLNLIK